jgi:hypothetical protein
MVVSYRRRPVALRADEGLAGDNRDALLAALDEDAPEERNARRKWERGIDSLEEGFTEFREAIRAGPTWRTLAADERKRIEEELLEIQWIDSEDEQGEG